MNSLIVACLASPSIEEIRVRTFCDWMGVHTKTIVLDDKSDVVGQLLAESRANGRVAMTADTLAALHIASTEPARLRGFFKECASLLVFGCGNASQEASLSWLTDGAVCRVTTSDEGVEEETSFQMPRASQEFSRQFAGLSFSIGRRLSQPVFHLDLDRSRIEPIMLANHGPVFAYQKIGSCQTFLLTGSEAPDIERSLSRYRGIENSYDRIIPFLIFLRTCFGENCWHALESTARFIIDDPLLKDRYGLLDYNALLGSMSRGHYGTSIAFIPWNYRRTSPQWAARLLETRANLSICVHGCDHTNKEFDALDTGLLAHKARLAYERMEKHRERTGLPFDPVMVFPQGRFSTTAIAALRANNYLAAVNTSCFPTDDAQDQLKLGEFLRPAVTRFHGFPIFQRHYPERLIDFAFDMFLGKPVLLVEHHQYLGDGCKRLGEFVADLHAIEPELSWPTLNKQLTESCILKNRATDSSDVKFFTRRFRLTNRQRSKWNFRLDKYEPDISAVRSVLVDGNAVPFIRGEDSIRLEIELEAGCTREIEVLDHAEANTPAKAPGVTYSFGVLFRRELSEFRDNTLARHPTALKAMREVARKLKMTGDRKKEKETGPR